MSDYSHEKWFEIYRSAMIYLHQSLMAGRILDARAEVMKRIEKLRELPGLNRDQSQALQDALNGSGMLERNEVAFAAEQGRKIGYAALEKLLSIAPKILILKSQRQERPER